MIRLLLFFMLTAFISKGQSPCVSAAVIGTPCAPATFQLFACTQDATDAQWSFPGSTNPTQNGLYVNSQYLSAGTYDVSVTISLPSGNIDTTFALTVSEAPDICVSTPVSTGCTGQTLCFDATCTNGTGLTYLWDFNDNTTSTLGNPCHDFIDSGCHDVALSVIDFYGCQSDTIFQDFACVDPALVACFSSTNPPCNCSVPYTVQLQSCSTPAGSLLYTWLTPGGMPSSPNGASTDVAYTNTGFYDVSLVVVDTSGCSDTLTIPDFVCLSSFTATLNILDSVFAVGVPITFESGPGFTFDWSITPATVDTTDNGQSVTVVFNQAGTYTVCLNSTFNGCSAEKCTTVVISNSVSVEETQANKISSFYDALSKQIIFSGFDSNDDVRFELFDVMGRRLLQQKPNISFKQFSINVGHLPNGIYGYRFTSNDSRANKPDVLLIR